jgi:putative ABC transport system ATP-binding protein
MIEFENVTLAYPQSEFRLEVADVKIAQGEHVALVGPSGSGKTTLLHLAAGILTPNAGEIRVSGEEITKLTPSARRSFRIRNIGLVFQEFELLEYLPVRENMLLPFRITNALKISREARESAEELATAVGIRETLDRYPHRLSQGERQRVAVGRALITQPQVLLADEPTGNLDPAASRKTIDLLLEQAVGREATVLMVTHDHGLLDRFDRVVETRRISEHDSTARHFQVREASA